MTTNKKKPSGRRPVKSTEKHVASSELRQSSKGTWQAREAKAKFSEVIKRVHSEGPQRVSVRGRQEVVIVTKEEFRRMKGEISGKALVDALAESPLRDVEFDRVRMTPSVRDVDL